MAVNVGLEIARFEPETTEKLKAGLPATANIHNPIDVIGDARADRYAAALDAVLDDPNTDQVLVILTPQSMTDIEEIAQGICDVQARADKPIAASFMGAADVAVGIDILQAAGIPHYILPEWACRAMADVQRIRRWRAAPPDEVGEALAVDQEAAAAIIDSLGEGYLREDQALAVLDAYGFPLPAHKLCRSADEAAEMAETIAAPVVLRIVSPQIVHKFDVKGVALDLDGPEAVRSAYNEMMAHVSEAMPDADIVGAICRPMIPDGHEVILGAKHDSVFGPTLMFGLGGLFVEVFKDVTFALAPLTAPAAARMVQEVKAHNLLTGARGTAPADVAQIEECLIRLGRLVTDFPRIAELDINPLIVGPPDEGASVADVRIRLSE